MFLLVFFFAAIMDSLQSFVGRRNVSERALTEVWAAAQRAEQIQGGIWTKASEPCRWDFVFVRLKHMFGVVYFRCGEGND